MLTYSPDERPTTHRHCLRTTVAVYGDMTAVAAGDEPRKNGIGGGGDEGTTPPPAPTQKQQQQLPPPPPLEQGLRCPRCDSPNTKFCYYNNYSLSQPRHFCKTCRRYWTKGGALRNVPVGGGCRKNKRSRSTVGATSRLSVNLPLDGCVGGGVIGPAVDQQSSARLGFLGGGAPVVSSPVGGPPAVDYQKGAAAGMMAPPRLHVPAVGQYAPFAGWPSGPAAVDLTGGGSAGGNGSSAGHASTNVAHAGAASSSIASSIESLSFINQDLHWKLQQQRLSTMFLAMPTSAAAAVHVDGAAPPSHVGGAFFQMDPGAPDTEAVPQVTSWIMDSSYVLPSPAPPPPPANTAAATANCYINSGRSSGDGDDHATSNINGSSGGIPAWGDISTFAMLP